MKKTQCRAAEMLLACLLGAFAEATAFSDQDAGVKLSVPAWTNNQLQFTLNCESGVTYVIEHSADLQTWAPVLTNSDPSITRLITADAPSDAGFYRAVRGPLPVFAAAIAAVSTIYLKGDGITTDSYDSSDPNYSSNGLYPAGQLWKTKATGDVCTDGILTNSLGVGYVTIEGKLRTGPGTNTFQIGTNWSVGDRTWVEGGSNGIKSGWASADFNVLFPDVRLPTSVWLPANQVLPPFNIINGVSYAYIFKTNGDYQLNNLNGSVYVSTNAHVRLKINNSYITSSQVIRLDINNAYLQIFMVGSAFSLTGAAWIDNPSGHAERFYLFGLPGCTNISFGGNGSFYGGIYAPQADFTLGGGGIDTWDFVGSSVTKTVTVNGHYSFHYDENLARVGPSR